MFLISVPRQSYLLTEDPHVVKFPLIYPCSSSDSIIILKGDPGAAARVKNRIRDTVEDKELVLVQLRKLKAQRTQARE